MTNTEAKTGPPSEWIEIYKEVCANIRTTDDISFKLLGLVPTFAGTAAGALTIIGKSDFLSSEAPWLVLSLSIVGFLITLGFFRWELRNIKKCKWLVKRAKKLESYMLDSTVKLSTIQYIGWDEQAPPLNLKLSKWLWRKTESEKGETESIWGKTESEVLIYTAAMLAWCIPAVQSVVSLAAMIIHRGFN